MKSRSTPDIDNNYAYFDYEIKAVNDARNAENNYKLIDGSLFKREGDKLYFCGPDEDTMVVELEPFWLEEGKNHFAENLFTPLLQQIKDDFLNNDHNFKRVKFIFPYRLQNAWHWNAAELVFFKNKDDTWHVSGAKYDPYGVKRELEGEVIESAKTKFSEVILETGDEIVNDEIAEITFVSGQKSGVGCGMYTAFMLHKLKTQDFTTKEELDDKQSGIWVGIATSEKEQRAADLHLVTQHFPEKIEKFGKINEGNFVNSSQYLHNVASVFVELDVQDLKSLFEGNCDKILESILDRFAQAKKTDDQLAEKLDKIYCYLMLSLAEGGQQNSQKITEHLQSVAADIVKHKSKKSSGADAVIQSSVALDEMDPFSYQIHRHYNGLLEKINAIDQKFLGKKLTQISQAVIGLESDEIVKEAEKEIRERIASILKNKLLIWMAAKVFYEESPKEGAESFGEFPELKRVKSNTSLTDIENLLSDPNLGLWYENLDYHLDLYGSKIIEIEQDKKDRERQLLKSFSDARLEEENERRYQKEEDPDSIEWDYGDYEDDEDYDLSQESDSDSEDSEQESDESVSEISVEDEFYLSHYKEFSNPSNFENLIAISSNFGESPLCWLTYQIAEYDYDDLWNYMIEQILAHPNLVDLDSDLLKFIIYRASAFNGKVEDGRDESEEPIARDYDDEKLVSGSFITDSLVKYLAKINQEKLSQYIRNEFAYAKEMSEKGWLEELQKSYNEAHARNDLVTQNQIWSIFDLLQKNLKKLKFDEKSNPKKLLQSLEKAKSQYKERADQYYFRIYPQPKTNKLVYSSKREEKVAVIEMDKILGELEDVGQEIKKILEAEINTEKTKDKTNVVVPVLCFVVSSRPHKEDKSQRDHGRIIIPISCDFDVPKYLLSKDAADNVVAKSDQDFFKTAKSDSKYGMEKVKTKASLASQDPEPASQNNELLSHSERTMFEAFRKEENVRKIVTILHDELRKIYPEEINKEDRFKVYSVALLAYSSNSVCQLCSPAIIAHENYTQDSFLTLLTKNLREFTSETSGEKIKFFKVRGDVEKLELKSSKKSKSTKQAVQADIPEGIKQKFHLTTVVTSTKPFTIQSEDMCGAGKKAMHQNPQSRIYLEKDAIDLHKHEIGKDGRPIQDHYSFYEFSQSNFRKSLEKPDYKLPKKETKEAGLDFKFTGKTFMSGSKESKISNKKNRESVDTEVKTVIEAREAIRLRDLGKERFVTGVTSGNEL